MGGSGSRAQCRYRAEELARGRLCNPCMDTSRSWRTGRQTRAEVVCKVGGVFVPVVAVSAPRRQTCYIRVVYLAWRSG